MAGKLSKLGCPDCFSDGGTLDLRKVGRGDNNKYFWFSHYNGSGKPKRSCYIGHAKLVDFHIADSRYYNVYLPRINKLVEKLFSNPINERELSSIASIPYEAAQIVISEEYRSCFYLLYDMWPKRFVWEKALADLDYRILARRYQYFEEKGVPWLRRDKFSFVLSWLIRNSCRWLWDFRKKLDAVQ